MKAAYVRRSAEVQGMRAGVPARGALRLRGVLRPARGGLRLLGARRPRPRARGSRPGRRTSGATPTSCRSTSRRARRWPPGVTPLRAGRPPGRAARPGRGLGQERRRQPDALLQGPRGHRRAGQGRRSSATRWWPAPPPATWPTPWPRTPPPPGCDSYVFMPVRPRGAEDPRHRRLRHATSWASEGNYDDVNRLCTELVGRARLGLRERERAALLRRGLEDPGLRGRRAARLRAARPRRGCPIASGSLFTKIARGLRGVARGRAWSRASCRSFNGAQAEGCSPVAQAFEHGRDVCKPGASRTRSPSRWPSATRPTARTRSTWPGARAAAIDAVVRRRDPRRHPPAGRDHRHLHRDRRRRDHRGAARSSPSAATSGRRARGARDHRRGPEDPRRGARHASRPTRSSPRASFAESFPSIGRAVGRRTPRERVAV